ncbi:MAG TPA: TadE/TadG family type IV pilus assembly protein [Gaiellaceae bacterium]|nr:TadE/TadG family type IV pilus assembly protein [Gaiellaceae bacterium]
MRSRLQLLAPGRAENERGQAMVEFGLILLPLLVLVSGIIWFGIGLNYWLDMNRIANQGARWAVVDAWPNCPRTYNGACTGTTVGPGNSLVTYLRAQALTAGLQSTVTITVCYPTPDPGLQAGDVGTPVTVRLRAPFTVVPILGLQITLRADATMRIENKSVPTRHLVASACT